MIHALLNIGFFYLKFKDLWIWNQVNQYFFTVHESWRPTSALYEETSLDSLYRDVLSF